MNVNFDLPIVGFDGLPITRNGEVIPMYKEICVYLYNASAIKGSPLSHEQKYMAYSLCMRISTNPTSVAITTEEGSFIKALCAEKMSAGAYGQVVDMIEDNF